MGEATQIRTLIVDDEPLARVILREMLARDSEVEIVGECVNGHEAVEAIQTSAPDLIFLDVQMPEVGGFEVLEELKAESNYLERLVIKSGGRIFFLETDEIDWIEAEGNYVSVHTGKKSHLIRETISNLESKLDPKKFLRIHRSSIINLNRIQELQPWFHGEYHILLQDGTQLTLSRNYRERLQEALGKVF